MTALQLYTVYILMPARPPLPCCVFKAPRSPETGAGEQPVLHQKLALPAEGMPSQPLGVSRGVGGPESSHTHTWLSSLVLYPTRGAVCFILGLFSSTWSGGNPVGVEDRNVLAVGFPARLASVCRAVAEPGVIRPLTFPPPPVVPCAFQRYQDSPGVEHIPVVQIDLSVPLKVPGKRPRGVFLLPLLKPGGELLLCKRGEGSGCPLRRRPLGEK